MVDWRLFTKIIIVTLAVVVCAGSQSLDDLHVDNSLLRDLLPDPKSDMYAPNQKARLVRRGHYVPVKPTPLDDPVLISFSEKVADLIGDSLAHLATNHPMVR